ncbi:MAG TPA: EpsG family protein [Bryobacteraceae bacterium]|nr:EpsG family protein [Bryobacteraceae bacterium]
MALRYADSRYESHLSIVDGTAKSPYRYRVLLPYVIEWISQTASKLFELRVRTVTAGLYEVQLFVSLALGLILSFFHFRKYVPDLVALLGCLYLSGLVGFTYLFLSFQPWGWWELPVFTAGLHLILRNRRLLLVLLILVASFLRETAALLVPLYFIARFKYDTRKDLFIWTIILGIVTTAVFIGLRLSLGFAPHVGAELENPLTYRVVHNLTTPLPIINFLLFYNVLWYFSIKYAKVQPIKIRNCLLFIPLFLIVHALCAHMNETRYYFMIAPIIMPLALTVLSEKYSGERGEHGISPSSYLPIAPEDNSKRQEVILR